MNMIDIGMRGIKMGKVKRVRPKGFKNKPPPDFYTRYGTLSARADIGTYETWGKKIGVERIDEANQTRRETMSMLSLRNRAIDAGGRVTVEAAVDECEHLALDPLFRAGIFDDAQEPERGRWRHEAGVELFRLALEGDIMSRSTSNFGEHRSFVYAGVSEAEAEGREARIAMKFRRAMRAVGEHRTMLEAVCLDMKIPVGTKRSRLCAALDLLAEVLFGVDPPAETVRPRLRSRQH